MKKYVALSLFLFYYCSTSFAQNDVAMLSESCLYLGKKSFLKPGVYRADQLGIRDNNLSSFHLPDGMAMQVFEYDRYLGRTETFYSSVGCLLAFWNNKVSSVRVYWIHDPGNQEGNPGNNLPPQGNNVIFYKDNNYTGMAREVTAGNFESGALGFLAGNISSIYIPSGFSVRVNDKNGRTQTFTSSIANLNNVSGWDNRINSGFIDGNYNGGGGALPPPQGNRVIFYGDFKYSGMSRDFAIGSFSPASLGFLSSNISSIYIPQGQSVKVYDSRNNTRTFTTSIADLSQYDWNDKITTGIISGGSGGGPIPPQGNKVILYRDMKYSGMAKELDHGVFSSGSLGFLREQSSSFYIPSGWTLQVRDRNGRTQHFTNSISDLAQYGWDNKIYSGSISTGGQQGGNDGGQGGNRGTVNLYTDANFQGNATPCGEGRINYIGNTADNNISSIQIPPGFAVTVYDGQNLTGSSKTFTSSVSNLASHFGWDNRISSVYVYRQ